MVLNWFKRFVYTPRGLGLKVFIPITFIISLCLAFTAFHPFQEILKQEKIQTLILSVINQSQDEILLKKELAVLQSDTDYRIGIIAQALIEVNKNITELKNKTPINLNPEQLSYVLKQIFYLQMLFLSLFITLFSLICFFLLYIILKGIGPLFHTNLNKNGWGRILVFPSLFILVIYLIATVNHHPLSLLYLMAIDVLLALLIGVYLKKNA